MYIFLSKESTSSTEMYSKVCAQSVAYAGFLEGGGGRKFGNGDKNQTRILKTKKKGLHSDTVRFSARFSAQILKGRGAWLKFAHYSEVFKHYWQPKGGGA